MNFSSIIEVFTTTGGWISLITLTFMEVVLGIDNIIFVSIITNRAAKRQQKKGRTIGLLLALLLRLALLFIIQLVLQSEHYTLFNLGEHNISIKDLVLILGGLFLIYKSTTEIHQKFNLDENIDGTKKSTMKFSSVVIQIMIINLVFSLDSIITAIGLTQSIPIMMIAVIVSMIIMIAVTGTISEFIEKHPTIKMLALSFLLMIGCLLVVEALDVHVEKNYIYFTMAFSLGVEMLNIRLRKKMKKGV
jgi:predicted tellurium resistance membrane protein TerC